VVVVVREDNSRTGADSGVLENSDTYAYSSAVRRWPKQPDLSADCRDWRCGGAVVEEWVRVWLGVPVPRSQSRV